MFEETIFGYLDEEDSEEFEMFWHEDQELLAAGGKTFYRLQKYLPENEFFRIKVILSALVYDFKMPSVRYTKAVALMLYGVQLHEGKSESVRCKDIVDAELGLLRESLMTDNHDDEESEKELFDECIEIVSNRWGEYLSSPTTFVL